MANMANIIKNIDPPIELTQAEYNALTIEQKNNGTIYYVSDGTGIVQTAATTPAEKLNGKISDVQNELNILDNVINNAPTQQVGIHTAQYLMAPEKTGMYTDTYGNFHQKDIISGRETWAIRGTAQIGSVLRIYVSGGGAYSDMVEGGHRTLCFGAGDTFSSRARVAGYIANSSKSIRVPIPIFSCASSAIITNLKITTYGTGNATGGNLYMRYGSNTISLASSREIWKDSAQVYENSISSVSVNIRTAGWVDLDIGFVNALVNSSSTTVTSLTPIGIWITPTIVFS